MYLKVLSVSELNNYVKKIFDNDFILNNTNTSGEISNFKIHSSGHIYFSLKDELSKINCVMFKSSADKLKFLPENGMKVIIKGRLSVYQKEGTYQIYCDEMQMEGKGELYLAFEKLKEKLRNQGLFEESHKRQIPKFAKKIGVITSPTGAAVRDIINVVQRRNKNVEILIYPALVQGVNSSLDIIKGIERLNSIPHIDTIIIARGGGSLEELWSFNDEKLAYAIYNSKIPVITGVGHETDFTMADFVSDLRAPTPSAAAELSVFDLEELEYKILNYNNKLNDLMRNYIVSKSNRINLMVKTLENNNPKNIIVSAYIQGDKLTEKMHFIMQNKIIFEKRRLQQNLALLNAHNPLNILSKGYAIIEDIEGTLISEVSKLNEKNEIKIILKDGNVNVKIQKNM